MSKLHIKGFILQLLNENNDGLWDYEIAKAVMSAYNHKGEYWYGEIRATLTDLYSGALLAEIEDKLDDGRYFGAGKVLVRFRLTPFGRKRMIETGLLEA